MKCSECSEDAVIEVNWQDRRCCPEHYQKYFLSQVNRILEEYEVEGEIAVALSGGKDSSACLEALTHFDGLEVRPFYIDLGIGEYSEKSRKSAEDFSDELGLGLKITDLEKEYGTSLPEISEKEEGKVCGICGMVKRYLMNKYAYENGFDYVATGHNLSDEVAAVFNNLANVYLTPFRGLKPVLEPKESYKLAGRIKPLYFLKDNETRFYAETSEISYFHGECPLSEGSPTDELKGWLHELDAERPRILRNFAKSFMKIEERMNQDDRELGKCENCGYATATEVCRFCRLVKGTA